VSLALAAEHGFSYSSNLMDSDLPYLHETPQGLVELPVSWVLDDAPYFWFDEASWNKKIHSAADVMAIWKEEFAAAHAAGGYLMLTMHPQIIGRPARIRMLDDFISWMKTYHGVWMTSSERIARHVREHPGEFRREGARTNY
jgi:peptidoglycan/xylan/chitin deacetylase (PgdA/CDA1 family)